MQGKRSHHINYSNTVKVKCGQESHGLDQGKPSILPLNKINMTHAIEDTSSSSQPLSCNYCFNIKGRCQTKQE